VDLSLVPPAYHEAARIGLTIARTSDFLALRPWSAELIVVDDGSTDATADSVGQLAAAGRGGATQLRCLRHPANRGKGYSVRRGLGQAQGLVVGYMDADYKTDISALDEAMQWLASGADAVVGDRTLAATRIVARRRAYRELGSRLFRRLVRQWMGLGQFPDTQCGFKFFRAPVARQLFALQTVDGFMFDVEILLLAARQGLAVRPIPVQWTDDPDSRFRPLSGSLRNLVELLRIRRRLASLPRG
jgi:dolichyl-phosphate beta-glucosyltransferase